MPISKQMSQSATRDGLVQGRLFKLRSLTRYFFHKFPDEAQAQNGLADSSEVYETVLADVNKSITLMEVARDKSNAKLVDPKLATSRLFKARLHYENYFVSGQQGHDLNETLASLRKAQRTVEQINSDRLTPEESVEHKLLTAEIFQLRGEAYLTQAAIASNEEDAVQLREQSAEQFRRCVETLEEMQGLDDTRLLVRHSRALGRGYGYLGDMQREQAEFAEAFKSYSKSLVHRKHVVDLEAGENFESRLQLARGFGNFSRTLRNLGVVPEDDATEINSSDGSDTESTEFPMVNLADVGDKAKVKSIQEMMERYTGAKWRSPGKLTKEAGALHLQQQLKDEVGDTGSILAVMESNDVVAELYYQAARHESDETARSSLLECALAHCSKARENHDELPDAAKKELRMQRSLAYCLAMEIQVKRLQGDGEPNERCLEVVKLLSTESGGRELSNDELFLKCIAQNNGESLARGNLETNLKTLASNGYRDTWRLKQHFDTKLVNLFEEHRTE